MPLKLTSREGVFYATGSVAGQRVRKSLGTRDKGQAEELRAQYEARLWKRHSYGEAAVRTFDEAAVSYMEAGGEARFLTPLIKRFRGRVLGSITPGEIQDAARELYPTAAAGTRNRQGIVPARAVIMHGAARGWCAPVKVENFETTKPRRTVAGRDWINAFMQRADGDGLPHLSAAVLFMWQNGARISEAAGVLPEHFDAKARTIILPSTKEGAWEVCHLSHELTTRIRNLTVATGEPLFGYQSRHGIRRRAQAVCRRAGIRFIPAHQAGRHSYATNALRMGATPKQVMDGGRWKTARLVLEVYAHETNGGQEIAALFDTNRAQSKPRLRQVSGKKRGK